MNLPPVYSSSDVLALSSIRDKEKEEEKRRKELEAIGQFKMLQSRADRGEDVGAKSRQEMLSNLGLDIAQSPEAEAFRNSIAEDEAKKYGQDISFYGKQAADLPATQKINEDLGKANLSHLAVPTIMPKSPRDLANEYGYPASAAPQAKEAMGNIQKEESLSSAAAKVAPANNTAFSENDPQYEIAKRIAEENIPVSQWRPVFTSLGGKLSMDKPRILSTVYQINPNYDFVGNELGYNEDISHSRASGALQPDIIGKRGQLAHTTAMAQLEPDVQSGKIEQQSRGQSAKTLNNQRMAAQRALSTFDDASAKYQGHYENIPDWMYRDLASDYAKILMSTGQIAEGSIDKIMQKTGKAAIVNLWNYATGDTKTTAPDKVLSLLHNRIRALGTDLDKQYYNQVQGTNIPVNSREETNPYSTAAPGGDGFDEAKKKRLAELRAKKAAGTLGK